MGRDWTYAIDTIDFGLMNCSKRMAIMAVRIGAHTAFSLVPTKDSMRSICLIILERFRSSIVPCNEFLHRFVVVDRHSANRVVISA